MRPPTAGDHLGHFVLIENLVRKSKANGKYFQVLYKLTNRCKVFMSSVVVVAQIPNPKHDYAMQVQIKECEHKHMEHKA